MCTRTLCVCPSLFDYQAMLNVQGSSDYIGV